MRHLRRVDRARQKAADAKAGCVGVGKDDDSGLRGQTPDIGELFTVAEHAEAVGRHDGCIDERMQLRLIIAPFHDNSLAYPQHF